VVGLVVSTKVLPVPGLYQIAASNRKYTAFQGRGGGIGGFYKGFARPGPLPNGCLRRRLTFVENGFLPLPPAPEELNLHLENKEKPLLK